MVFFYNRAFSHHCYLCRSIVVEDKRQGGNWFGLYRGAVFIVSSVSNRCDMKSLAITVLMFLALTVGAKARGEAENRYSRRAGDSGFAERQMGLDGREGCGEVGGTVP